MEVIKYEDNDARNKLEPMWNEQREATIKFIKENPKSYISMYNLLFLLGDMQYNEAKAFYDNFDSKYSDTKWAKKLSEEIEKLKKGVPGAMAGDFNATDINGNPIKLADFKGNYLLIDFWASWCVPCRKGNPHLISLYKKYNPKGLEILGVSDDDRNPDAWRKAIKKDNIGIWRHVLRGLEYKEGTHERINIDKDISEGYNIHTLPTKILINPEGMIVGRYGGGGGTDEDLDRDLAEIFEK
ncbi:TlpA disulfide reductase family protein [Aureibaculum sp. 2210JD6-5]|uniref:TlpA family protein disulfide reductase n=1 Tax=Aureibaculum sp. 2210JD6-5 TaxID=3103957 RepID=UPI002AAEF8D2|nr:TlpA disulfide reductase family protein [Aureibaculum sp. 2210JD6-5]MDY7396946.1 TlpA disulfide reductase family protein [Aureibaculum sp. 2210JD6-5]